MEQHETYQALAHRLDSFPQGFPSTESGKELEILAYLFSPEEAHLASYLSLSFTPLEDISAKAGYSLPEARKMIKNMATKGLIFFRRGESGIEVMLLPFVVGFYEMQVSSIDETFAKLCEDYFHEAFSEVLSLEPQFNRVIPVNTSIDFGVEILPEENVVALLSSKKAWAVQDCICRKQQALLGNACEHPLRMCLVMSDMPGVFDGLSEMEMLDLDSALCILDEAAKAGLVHTVSNQKKEISYVCNCCTCSCGLLRGIAEANIANVVAKSYYYARVNVDDCVGCGTCEVLCQFGAISMTDVAQINKDVCVGCGVCARSCPEGAISLSLREPADMPNIPDTKSDWLEQRKRFREQL